jgi:hypothetical protein
MVLYDIHVHNDGVGLHGLSKKTMDAIMMTATLVDVRETGPDDPIDREISLVMFYLPMHETATRAAKSL